MGTITTDPTTADLATGCHYDYVTQQWVDGHDHAHLTESGPQYCGADLATCQGK